MKLAVPLILLNFTLVGEAADLPLSHIPAPPIVHQYFAKCYTSPTGLKNPHWTIHQKFFEGTKCWHSTNSNKIFVEQPPKLPVIYQLYQQYQQWLEQQKYICMGVLPGDCYLR